MTRMTPAERALADAWLAADPPRMEPAMSEDAAALFNALRLMCSGPQRTDPASLLAHLARMQAVLDTLRETLSRELAQR